MFPVLKQELDNITKTLGIVPEFVNHFNNMGQAEKNAIYYNFTVTNKKGDSQPHYYILVLSLYVLGDIKSDTVGNTLTALGELGYSMPLPVDSDDVGNTLVTVQKTLMGVF